jgi:hypothetical protein
MKLVPTTAFFLLAAIITGCKSADAPDATADATKPAGPTVASKDSNASQAPTGASAATTTPPASTPDASKPAPPAANPNASQYSIVGAWNVDDIFKGTYEYKADGTMTFHFTDPQGTIWDGSATYKLESGKLSQHMVSVHFTPGPKADASLRKSLEEANSKPPPAADETAAFAWKDKDTLLLTGSDGKSVTTITRKK